MGGNDIRNDKFVPPTTAKEIVRCHAMRDFDESKPTTNKILAMKLSPPNVKRISGMTLLELTVVILVLLALISVLFVGARAWKRGSDRAANILNIRNVQQAVRGHANVRALNIGDALVATDIVGTDKYIHTVTPPNIDISYSYGANVPTFGTLYLVAAYVGTTSVDYAPATTVYTDW